MIPCPLRACGILVTVRLPRSAARPGPALLAQGDDPPGPRRPQASAGPGGNPPEPPAGLRPLRHGAWALLARGDNPPGTPRWPQASFLRHGAWALLALAALLAAGCGAGAG